MLHISSEQLQILGRDLTLRLKSQSVTQIVSHLCSNAPELMSRYGQETHHLRVEEVVDVCQRLGINEPRHVLNWSYIRLLTGLEFYYMEEFKDILNHPFLHPEAKGRHIVLSFFTIQRINQGSKA